MAPDQIARDLADLLGLDTGPSSTVAGQSRPVTPAAVDAAPSGWISQADLAALLGLSSRQITTLRGDGVLKPVGSNPQRPMYDMAASVRGYCETMRAKASRGVAVHDAHKDEKIRKERAAAERIELQNQLTRRELISEAEAAQTYGNLVRDVRSGLLAVPSRCGAALPKLTPGDIGVIDAEIRAALERLADGH